MRPRTSREFAECTMCFDSDTSKWKSSRRGLTLNIMTLEYENDPEDKDCLSEYEYILRHATMYYERGSLI